MGQKPGEFHIVSCRGIVRGIGLGTALLETVPAPHNVELDLWRHSPVAPELGNARAILGVQDLVSEELNGFNERALMQTQPCTFIQVGIGLHQVHVHIQGLSVTACSLGAAQCPVPFEHLPVAAIACICRMFLDQIKHARGIVTAPRIPGGHRVLTQGIHGKTEAIQNLLVHGHVALSVHGPEETAMLGVPHLVDQKIDAMSGIVCTSAVTIPGPMGTGHGVDRTRLRDERLFVLTRVTSVPVKVRDKAAVLIVSASVKPERQQFSRQMALTFRQAGRYVG